jgi:hypothetical protein
MSTPAFNVIDVSEDGLVLEQDDQLETIGWQQIEVVAVGAIAGTASGTIVTMVLELACGRMALCTEEHPVWLSMIDAMKAQLPSAVPLEAWAPAVAIDSRSAVVIYSRMATQ